MWSDLILFEDDNSYHGSALFATLKKYFAPFITIISVVTSSAKRNSVKFIVNTILIDEPKHIGKVQIKLQLGGGGYLPTYFMHWYNNAIFPGRGDVAGMSQGNNFKSQLFPHPLSLFNSHTEYKFCLDGVAIKDAKQICV